MKTFFLVILLLFFSSVAHSANSTFDHSHTLWNEILHENVKMYGASSLVNYKNILSKPEKLNKYLAEISKVNETDFNNWNKSEQLAFLINAYNAFTVKLIIDNFPVKSIKDIGRLFSNPWKKKFFILLNEKRSLDWIEHEKIRPVFNEPKIHFALVCASKGCPALQNEAFIASKLDNQLYFATRLFLKDNSRNDFNFEKKIFNISSIFKWYKEDFTKSAGSVEAFIIPIIADDNIEILKLLNNSFRINYLDYDWTLNGS